MAQKSKRELAKMSRSQRKRLEALLADPISDEIMVDVRRKLLRNFKRDADKWYSLALSYAENPSANDNRAGAQIILAMIRTFLAERKEVLRPDAAPTQAGGLNLAIVVPAGQTIERGTVEAHTEALEIGEQRRIELDERAKQSETLHRAPVDNPVP